MHSTGWLRPGDDVAGARPGLPALNGGSAAPAAALPRPTIAAPRDLTASVLSR